MWRLRRRYLLPRARQGAGIQSFHLSALNISGGATVVMSDADVSSDRSVLVLGSLSFGGTSLVPVGKLDLGDNDLIVRNGNAAAMNADLASGFANGSWAGSAGIVSSTAHSDTTFLTAIGFYTGSSMPFDGQSISSTDLLVKYTYYGDANLDGKVDASDYSRVDNTELLHLTGWWNGDFNYDGVVNGSDYTLMDNAFNRQGAVVASQIATGLNSTATPGKKKRFQPNGALHMVDELTQAIFMAGLFEGRWTGVGRRSFR